MAMLNHQMVIGSSYFNIFQLFWGWYSHRNHQRWCAKHQQGPCACGPTRAMAPWLAAKRARDGRMPGYFWWDGMGTDGHGKWWKLVPKQHVFFSAPKGSSFAYERGILEPTEDWGVSAAPGIKVENIWKYNQVTGTNGWSFSSVVSSEKHLQLSPFSRVCASLWYQYPLSVCNVGWFSGAWQYSWRVFHYQRCSKQLAARGMLFRDWSRFSQHSKGRFLYNHGPTRCGSFNVLNNRCSSKLSLMYLRPSDTCLPYIFKRGANLVVKSLWLWFHLVAH